MRSPRLLPLACLLAACAPGRQGPPPADPDPYPADYPLVATEPGGRRPPPSDPGRPMEPGPRARELGVPFEGRPGPLNAITDVPGVRVGHQTVLRGEGELAVRTGVTAIRPTPKGRRLFAATFDLNGNGELTGTHLIDEWGLLLSPILLTNTLSVGTVHEAVVRWSLARADHPRVNLPVVGETWDGRLNDIDGLHVEAADVFAALDAAEGGPVREGNVGGGTGMVAYGFKGGIGTASRVLPGDEGWTVGVLVQANHGRRERLTIAGVPVGEAIDDLQPEVRRATPIEGSIIVVVATDAPLLPHQLARVAKRATHGLARTGAVSGTWSGDLFLAFSTAAIEPATDGVLQARFLGEDRIDAVFAATVQATEEAIVNALVAARTMTGYQGNTVYALPHDRLRAVLERYGRLVR